MENLNRTHSVDNCSKSNDPLDFNDTVIFFDWDDTLFPTSFLQAHGLHNPGPGLVSLSVDIQTAIRNCEDMARTAIFIANCITRHVYIVTNASSGWVQHTAVRYYPNLCADGTFDNIIVISARSEYSHLNINNPMLWKYHAMHQIISDIIVKKDNVMSSDALTPNIESSQCKTIISIGDSDFERIAIRLVHSQYENISLKVVKLIDRPESCDHLRVQLCVISEWMMSTQTEQKYVELWTQVNEDLSVFITDSPQVIPSELSLPQTPSSEVFEFDMSDIDDTWDDIWGRESSRSYGADLLESLEPMSPINQNPKILTL